jgi:hypothetical protein
MIHARYQSAIDHLKEAYPGWVSNKVLCDACGCPKGSSSVLARALKDSGVVQVEERFGQRERIWYCYKGDDNAVVSQDLSAIDGVQRIAIKSDVFKVLEPLAKKYPCDALRETFNQALDYLA